MQEFSVVEQNLRRLLQQADQAIHEHPGKQNIQSCNLPSNPFDKKLFNKRGRSSRFNAQRCESEQRLPLNPLSSGKKKRSQSNHKSESKQKRVLFEYLQDDLVERRIEENNRMFREVVEFVEGVRDRVNQRIRQAVVGGGGIGTTGRSGGNQVVSRRGVYQDSAGTNRSSQLLLSNIKSFFQQLFQPTTDPTKQFPKRIDTVIEFQTIQNTVGVGSPLVYRRTLPQQVHTECLDSSTSGVSYFRKSLIGLPTRNQSSHSRMTNQKSLENTLKGSRQTITTEAQKKSSVYETVLNQRKAKLKKNK